MLNDRYVIFRVVVTQCYSSAVVYSNNRCDMLSSSDITRFQKVSYKLIQVAFFAVLYIN